MQLLIRHDWENNGVLVVFPCPTPSPFLPPSLLLWPVLFFPVFLVCLDRCLFRCIFSIPYPFIRVAAFAVGVAAAVAAACIVGDHNDASAGLQFGHATARLLCLLSVVVLAVVVAVLSAVAVCDIASLPVCKTYDKKRRRVFTVIVFALAAEATAKKEVFAECVTARTTNRLGTGSLGAGERGSRGAGGPVLGLSDRQTGEPASERGSD